jgi:predicted transcriptional regulator
MIINDVTILKNRSSIDTVAQILDVAGGGSITKTQIMFKVAGS